MTTFTDINAAINHIANVMGLDTDDAELVYTHSDCPRWDDPEFAYYDFFSDEKAVEVAASL